MSWDLHGNSNSKLDAESNQPIMVFHTKTLQIDISLITTSPYMVVL